MRKAILFFSIIVVMFCSCVYGGSVPNVACASYVVYDRGTDTVVFGKNENMEVPMASTTKIMTAIIAIENGNLDDIVEVSKNVENVIGWQLNFKEGDKISFKDLLYAIMLYSANDGAIAIAEYISGSVNEICLLMNKKAAELGAYNTNFTSPHGLDNDKHYSTPYDLAVILDYALNNELFRKVFNTKSYVIHINGYERSINNTNKLITTNNACFGGKTGYTGKGGYCLASNYIECDNDYIVVTLGNGTSKQRFSDNENLFKYGIDNYTILNTNDFLNERQNIFLVKCNETIEFERNGNEYFSVHNSDLDKISVKYIVSENIELPISINQVLGKGEIYLGENMVASLEYVALKDYVKTSFLDYFKYIIYNYTKLIKLI